MQSESVELRILLSWSDELTIYTLLPLHRALHVAHVWPNSKYEDINEILYRPSIIPGGVVEQVWGGFCPSWPPPHKTTTANGPPSANQDPFAVKHNMQ